MSEMGPLLLSRLFNLNDIQAGVLTIVFRLADEDGLMLLDVKDMREMLKFVSDNAAEISSRFGRVSAASVGAIQRALLDLEARAAKACSESRPWTSRTSSRPTRRAAARSTSWPPTP